MGVLKRAVIALGVAWPFWFNNGLSYVLNYNAMENGYGPDWEQIEHNRQEMTRGEGRIPNFRGFAPTPYFETLMLPGMKLAETVYDSRLLKKYDVPGSVIGLSALTALIYFLRRRNSSRA